MSARVFLTRHAARARRSTARLHHDNGRGGSACGDLVLDRDTGRPARSVPGDRRCGGRGCAERWAPVDQPADLITTAEESSP